MSNPLGILLISRARHHAVCRRDGNGRQQECDVYGSLRNDRLFVLRGSIDEGLQQVN